MILGPDGEKLSKRHGAVNVMEYDKDGYLPEAMINYLARLGWSHGNDELFTREQLVEWFDTRNLTKSRSEEHTSELQSLMRISYAVFCLKKKHKNTQKYNSHHTHHNL